MNRRTFYIVPLLLILFQVLPASVSAQEIHTFNLQQCIEYAYEHQESVKNAQLDVEKANWQVKEILGSGFPQISGNANLQDYLKIPTTLIPGDFVGQPGTFIPVKFGVKYSSSFGLNLDQLLFDGSFVVGVQASKTFKELYQRSLTRSRIETNVAVTKSYYQVLVSGEQVTLTDVTLKQLKQQLNETAAMNKEGFVEKIDVDRLRVLLNNLQTTRENALRMMALGYQALKFQIGMPISDVLIVNEKIADVKFQPAAVGMTDTTTYRKRIEYELLQTNRKLMELDVKRYKALLLPSLSGFASSSANFQNNSFGSLYGNNFPTTLIGVRLRVPIFTGFQTKSKIKQAEIELKKTDNSNNLAIRGFNLEIETAATNYTSSIATLTNERENMALAREVLRVSKIKYEQGVGSSIEVTQAQTALQEAETNYIQALYSALVYKVDVEKANGTIR